MNLTSRLNIQEASSLFVCLFIDSTFVCVFFEVLGWVVASKGLEVWASFLKQWNLQCKTQNKTIKEQTKFLSFRESPPF